MNLKHQCAPVFAEYQQGQVKGQLEFLSDDLPEENNLVKLV